jgi:hypothetical protein
MRQCADVRLLRLGIACTAFVLASCHAPCGHINCGGPGVQVDLRRLPSAWLRGARVTGCIDGRCRQTELTRSQSNPYIFMPIESRSATLRARDVEVRISVDGRRIFTGSGKRLPVWTKRSRCTDCTYGSVFAEAEPDGALRSHAPPN